MVATLTHRSLALWTAFLAAPFSSVNWLTKRWRSSASDDICWAEAPVPTLPTTWGKVKGLYR